MHCGGSSTASIKGDAVAEEAEKPKGQTITVTQAGALLNRTPRWVQNLVAAGFITKSKRGAYTLVEVVRGAVAYYEDQLEKANKAAAASRATDARTREIELRIAERKRELIPQEDAMAVVSELAGMVRAEFSGLPARFTRDLEQRRRLEQEINGTFERLSAAASRAGTALATGGGAVASEPEA